MADTVYLRNNRPNRVVLTHAGLRVVLERRGSREDSVSFPAASLQDATTARWLRAGIIEQISKDAFLDLAARIDAYDPNVRSENEPTIVSDIRDRDLPLIDDKTTPNIIDTDKIDRTLLSPSIEWETPPDPTPNSDLAPQEVPVRDLHRGVTTGRPANLGDSPNAALVGEGERPNVVDTTGDTKPKAPVKKKTTTRKKATPKK